MAFVNEIISDQDKAAFDFSRIKRPPIYATAIDPYRWTIDRDRGVFLIWLLGSNEDEQNAKHFALWWKDAPIYMKLLHDAVGQNSVHVLSTWSLAKLDLSSHLAQDRSEILNVLREALAEYKVGGGVPVASHEVHFKF